MPALFILFGIALIAAGPLVTIWALNTLFPTLAIPYTFWTWLAVIAIAAAFRANIAFKRRSI